MVSQQPPEGRYGSRASRRNPRWVAWALLALALVAGVTVAVVGYRNLGTQPIESEQAAFRILGDDGVRVTIRVWRDEPQRAAACVVRARAEDGGEVGRKEVLVEPSEGATFVRTVIRTSKRPVTGEVFGCSYKVPAYLVNSGRPTG